MGFLCASRSLPASCCRATGSSGRVPHRTLPHDKDRHTRPPGWRIVSSPGTRTTLQFRYLDDTSNSRPALFDFADDRLE
jgi:hypothetical protein